MTPLLAAIPLAQRSHWERLGDQFTGSNAQLNTGDALGVLFLIAAGVALIVLLRQAAIWQERRASRPQPTLLFQELCRAHRLTRPERRVLSQIASLGGLSQPAEVFLRPELLATATADGIDLDRLRTKLFEETFPSNKSPSAAPSTAASLGDKPMAQE